MKDLAVRLAALDPDASAALQVIAYFDKLVEGRAGLSAIVRGAAALAGCPARLVDDARHLSVRAEPDGTPGTPPPRDPRWPSAAASGAVLSLERDGVAQPVDAMVLERAAAAASAVLDRTRHRAGPPDDPAAVEVLLDAAAPAADRLAAGRRLGLAEGSLAAAVAVHGGGARVVPAGAAVTGVRAGIGPAVPVGELPSSWGEARTALRFTAEGTDADPGPRVVRAEELGTLVLLADVVRPGGDVPPDVRTLSAAAAASPVLLATLDAVATTASVRTAAAVLRVHHSTLQERVTAAERALGWDVREPRGRLRLQLALVARRLLSS